MNVAAGSDQGITHRGAKENLKARRENQMSPLIDLCWWGE